MAKLLGKHEIIAQNLYKNVRALSNGDPDCPSVVLLKGPSGVGKTAIVQRLYELLREDAEEASERKYAQYWPELIPDWGENNPLKGRALLAPNLDEFQWDADTLPTFGWWAFNCEELRNNQKVNVVSAGKEQMAVHMAPLTLAWWEASGFTKKVGRTLSELMPRIRDELTSITSDSLLDASFEALQIGVPLPTSIVSWCRDAVGWANRRRTDRKNLHADVALGKEHVDSKKDAGTELAEAIRSLAAPGLPGIVVIEDMHLMGPDLRSLLETLAETNPEEPVLVIGTTWPEGMTDSEFGEWRSEAMHAGKDNRRVWEIDVPNLESELLIELLLRHAPNTAPDVAQQIVEKLNTPLFLLLWLTDPAVELEIRLLGNKIQLTDSFRLPDSIEQVVASRWKAIPQDVQDALIAATAGNPLDPDHDSLNRFVPHVIAHVANEMYNVSTETANESLAKARNPIGWCKGTERVANFSDPLLTRHVRKMIQDLAAVRSAAQQFASTACYQWLEEKRDGLNLPDSPEVNAVVDWYMQFAPEQRDSVTTAAVYVHRATQLMISYDYVTALEYLGLAQGMLADGATQKDELLVLKLKADCHYELAEFEKAKEIVEKIVPLQVQLEGLNGASTWEVQLRYARVLLRSGDPTDALPVLAGISERIRACYTGASVPETIIDSVVIPVTEMKARIAFENRVFDRSVQFYEEAIGLAESVDDESSARLFDLKFQWLTAKSEKDPTDESVFEEGTALLEKIRDVYGQQSFLALDSECKVIFWGYLLKKFHDNEQQFQELDAKVPESRNYAPIRALLYLRAGDIAFQEKRLEDAKDWYEKCLPILRDHHGMEDPVTLRVMHQYSAALFQRGQREEAEDIARKLVAHSSRAVTPAGWTTMLARLLLIRIVWSEGRVDEGISLLKETREIYNSDPIAGARVHSQIENLWAQVHGVSDDPIRPLVQQRNGAFGSLSRSMHTENPLWYVEGDRPFPKLQNQLIALEGQQRMLKDPQGHEAFFLDTLSRIYLNLGASYWILNDVRQAASAFHEAEHAVRLLFQSLAGREGPKVDFLAVQIAARSLVINMNYLGLMVVTGKNEANSGLFEARKDNLRGLLQKLSEEDAVLLGNVDMEFLRTHAAAILEG